MFRFALGQGMSWKRARVLAAAASYGEKFWGFQRGLAEFVECSLRTVQRAFDEAKTLGIIYSRRSKQGEIPPGMARPFKCGFAMRTFSAWGLRSTRRIGAVCARYAHSDMYRRMRAAQNKRDKAEIREAVAELRSLGP